MQLALPPGTGCKGKIADLGQVPALLVLDDPDVGIILFHYRGAMLLSVFQLNAEITIVVDTPFPHFVLITDLLVECAVLRELADRLFSEGIQDVYGIRACCSVLPSLAFDGIPGKELAHFIC